MACHAALGAHRTGESGYAMPRSTCVIHPASVGRSALGYCTNPRVQSVRWSLGRLGAVFCAMLAQPLVEMAAVRVLSCLVVVAMCSATPARPTSSISCMR